MPDVPAPDMPMLDISRPERMAFLRMGGQRVFYTDSAAQHVALHAAPHGAHPVLLCIHGAGCTHLSWPPALRSLPDLRVLALDLPGHGDSAGPGRATIKAYAHDVIRFVESLGLTRVVVAGHSMGGAIALALAVRSVPWLAGLVLVGTGARLPVAKPLLEGLQHDFAATAARLGRWFWGPTAAPMCSQISTDTLRRQGGEVVRNDFLACSAFDVRTHLPSMQTPTLVIGGEQDRMMPLAYSEFLAEQIPRAQLITLQNVGHMMQLEDPQRSVDSMRRFVCNL